MVSLSQRMSNCRPLSVAVICIFVGASLNFGVQFCRDVWTSRVNSLQKYEDTLHTLIEPFCGPGYAAYWSVIGSICGTNWDKDFVMNEIDSNIYESEPLALNVGEEFKVRYWGSWSTNFGVDGFNGRNFKVEENGVYVVRITVISSTEAIIDITLVE